MEIEVTSRSGRTGPTRRLSSARVMPELGFEHREVSQGTGQVVEEVAVTGNGEEAGASGDLLSEGSFHPSVSPAVKWDPRH